MTLKVRNRLLLVFLASTLACIAVAVALLIVASIQKAIIPPPVLRVPPLLDTIPFAPYSFTAEMISTLVLVLYVPIVTVLLLANFEKTQSTEVIFFTGFLIACLCEGFRLITPVFGLWKTFSTLLIFTGRIVCMGRILAPLSFLFAAIMNDNDQRQNVERNITIMYAVCIVFAVVIPLDTARISSTCAVCWGFPKLFLTIRGVIIATAFVSFIIASFKHENPDLRKIAYYYLIVILGYALLVSSDNYLFLISGSVLLFYGTIQLLVTLHSMYLWR